MKKRAPLAAICLAACFSAALRSQADGPVPRSLAPADARRIAEFQTKGVKSGLDASELAEIRGILKPAAERGDVDAQIGMGNSFFYMEVGKAQRRGDPVPFEELAHTDYYYDYYCADAPAKDLKDRYGQADEAERWLRKAAEAGSPRAMIGLTVICMSRIHRLGADPEQKAKCKRDGRMWAEKAAAKGSVAACFILAEKLNEAKDEEEHEKTWFRWMAEGAKLGNVSMQRELGAGCFEKKRYVEAEKWLRMAARNGNRRAFADMAWLCIRTGRHAEAETWFDKAAVTDNGKDPNFWTLRRIAKDAVEACAGAGEKALCLKWRIKLAGVLEQERRGKKAADSKSKAGDARPLEVAGGFFGDPDYDQKKLGRLQHEIAKTLHWGATEQDGDGNWTKTVKPDVRNAMKWYAKAAGNGHYESLNTLCEYYYRNDVLDEAAKYLETGEKIKGEHQGRMKYLLACCLILRDGKQVGYRSNRLIEEAAELGDPEAAYIAKERKARKGPGRE